MCRYPSYLTYTSGCLHLTTPQRSIEQKLTFVFFAGLVEILETLHLLVSLTDLLTPC